MRTRSSRKKKSAAAGLFSSPKPELVTTTPTSGKSLSESPKEFEFNFDTPKLVSSSSTKRKTVAGNAYASMMKPAGNSSSPKSISTVSDLKELTSSRLESIKRQLERSHSEICKDVEASESRLQKRYKIQNQAFQQVSDETEREYRKISSQISEGLEAMEASYNEFMANAQASAARLSKSIPEISKSVEKALDSVRNRYGIPSASVC